MPSACVRLHDDACELCHLGERSMWHGLDSRARNLLAGKLTRREYGSGEVVIAQGEANDGVYCISSGTVAMRRLDGAGNSVLLCFGYPGDVIGYQAFLAGRPHQNSAEALGPTVTCRIGRATLTALLEAIPALGLRFLKRSIGEAEQAYDAIFRQSVLSEPASPGPPAAGDGAPGGPIGRPRQPGIRTAGVAARSRVDDRRATRNRVAHHEPARIRRRRVFLGTMRFDSEPRPARRRASRACRG